MDHHRKVVSSLPELRRSVLAAAVPHWFSQDVLQALLPDEPNDVGLIYKGFWRSRLLSHTAQRKAIDYTIDSEKRSSAIYLQTNQRV